MRVMIVEDDKELCQGIGEQLKKEGYEIDLCFRGDEAMYYIRQKTHDVIVLDRMLPGMDGVALIKEIRKEGIGTPVIMVTAMNGLNDRIDGLDAGADDYLVKPFAMEELFARIRALLRRPRAIENIAEIQYENLVLDIFSKVLKQKENGEQVTVSKRECALLEFFFKNPGQIIGREQILARVWGGDTFVEDGNIDNYIHFIRRRLKAVHSEVKIKTVYGVGYRLEKE
ncbi:MAG: response regulator transcription factor [Lachnospiraceae bacterium]|nr:response regulator transcription factor [Lachnospiraceae bacterium]